MLGGGVCTCEYKGPQRPEALHPVELELYEQCWEPSLALLEEVSALNHQAISSALHTHPLLLRQGLFI